MKNKFFILLMATMFIGCDSTIQFIKTSDTSKTTPAVITEESEDAKAIADSLAGADLHDCRILYIVTKGTVSYLEHGAGDGKTTKQLFDIYNQVLEDYKLEKEGVDIENEKLNAFELKMEDIILKKGYVDPKRTVDEYRADLISIFNDIADGCQLAVKNKVN